MYSVSWAVSTKSFTPVSASTTCFTGERGELQEEDELQECSVLRRCCELELQCTLAAGNDLTQRTAGLDALGVQP